MNIDETLKEKLRVFRHVSALTENDELKLREVASVILPHIPALTDKFYEQLKSEPKTAKFIEGRVDILKNTHVKWLEALFSGNYDEAFIDSQIRIGKAHVVAGIPPLFVASSMSYLRAAFSKLINQEFNGDDKSSSDISSAILRILDLCQFLIDHAYEQDRLERLGKATGLSRPLLENLIALK